MFITASVAGSVSQYIVYWTGYWPINRSEFQSISSDNIHHIVSSTWFIHVVITACVYVCYRPHSASLGTTERWDPQDDIDVEVFN